MIGSTIIGAGRLTAGRKNGFSRTPLDAFRIEHGPNFLIADTALPIGMCQMLVKPPSRHTAACRGRTR